MIARALSKSAALFLLLAPLPTALMAQDSPVKETMPTWYVVKSDGSTSAPVIDAASGSVLGFLPKGAEILTFGGNKEVLMVSLNRRTALVPVSAVTPKYPLPPERPELVISPGGLEKNIAAAKEKAKKRREEGLAPRAMATPFGFVEEDKDSANGGNAGGGAAGGGGGRGGDI